MEAVVSAAPQATPSSNVNTRPEWACLMCPAPSDDRPWKPSDESYRTCESCLKKIRKQLKDISERYGRLDITPGAQGEVGSRGAPGFGSKPTASVHIICMRDPRSSSTSKGWIAGDGKYHKEPERPPLSVYNELETLAWEICERRGFDDGPDAQYLVDVHGLCWWLDNQLDWVTRQADVAQMARAIRSIDTKLMPVTGDPRIFVAKCPNILDQGDHVTICDANLYYPTSGDVIMCGNPECARKWESNQWDSDAPGSLKNLIKDRRDKEKPPVESAAEQAETAA